MGVGFPDSFQPTNRDYALNTGLQSANPFNTGRLYQTDWSAWESSFVGRLSPLGFLEIGSTSALFYGMNRLLMPRLKMRLQSLGVRGFWSPLLLSSVAFSMVTSALMTTWQRHKYGSLPNQSGLQQWGIGLLYSIPTSILGLGGAQIFRNISKSILFDFALMEPAQAIASATVGSILESTGVQARRDLTIGQRFAQEFAEGMLYFSVGRAVGSVATVAPRVVGNLQRSYGDPAYEVGAVGDLADLPSPHRASRSDLPPDIDPTNPPWIRAPWRDPDLEPVYYGTRSDGLKSEDAGKVAARRLRDLVRATNPVNRRWEREYGGVADRVWDLIMNVTDDPKVQHDLVEKLLVRGLRDGVRPSDGIPYICPIPFTVMRAKDGVRFDPKASPYFDPVIDGDTPHIVFDARAAAEFLMDMSVPSRVAKGIRRTATYDMNETDALIDDRPVPPAVLEKIRGLFLFDAEAAQSILGKNPLPEPVAKIAGDLSSLDATGAIRLLGHPELPKNVRTELRKTLTVNPVRVVGLLEDPAVPIQLARRLEGLLEFNARMADDLFYLTRDNRAATEEVRKLFRIDQEGVRHLLKDGRIRGRDRRSIEKMLDSNPADALHMMAKRFAPPDIIEDVKRLILFDAEAGKRLYESKTLERRGQDRLRRLLEFNDKKARAVTEYEPLSTAEADRLRQLLLFDAEDAVRLLEDSKTLEGDIHLRGRIKKLFVFDQEGAKRLVDQGLLPSYAIEKIRTGTPFDSKMAVALLAEKGLPQKMAGEIRRLMKFDIRGAVELLADEKIPRQVSSRIRRMARLDFEEGVRLVDEGGLPPRSVEIVENLLRDCGLMKDSVTPRLTNMNTTEATHEALEQSMVGFEVTEKVRGLFQVDTKAAQRLFAQDLHPTFKGVIGQLLAGDLEPAIRYMSGRRVPRDQVELLGKLVKFDSEGAARLVESGELPDDLVAAIRKHGKLDTKAAVEILAGKMVPQKVLPPEWRCLRGEVGAYGGWKFLKEMIAANGGKIYLRIYDWDTYGRPVAEVLVKKGSQFDPTNPLYKNLKITLSDESDPYINLNLAMVEEGWGHVYIITPEGSGDTARFMAAEDAARAAKRGLWADPYFQEARLFITSNHSYRHHNLDDPRHLDKHREKPTAADSEYLRVFALKERINLKGYKIQNGDFEVEIKEDFWLERGRGVKILTHASLNPADRFRDGRYSTEAKNRREAAELFYDLRLDVGPDGKQVRDPTYNYFDEDEPLAVVAPDGKVLCMDVACQTAYRKLPPEFKRLRGFHF